MENEELSLHELGQATGGYAGLQEGIDGIPDWMAQQAKKIIKEEKEKGGCKTNAVQRLTQTVMTHMSLGEVIAFVNQWWDAV